MPRSALPPHLQDKLHTDYTWPFSLIPRSWTSYKLKQPPKMLIGHKVLDYTRLDYSCGQGDIKDAPSPCQKHSWSWYISWPLYFTITFGKSGWYLRIGCRWDSVDHYYTIPSFRIKKITLKDDELIDIDDRGIWREWECDL